MGFRLRRSARLGPLRFNFSSGGLISISVGGRGASFNIPVNRSGGPRTTVGLPNSRCWPYCARGCSQLAPPASSCGSTAW